MPFKPIASVVERFGRGEMIVVVDGPDRENEGDLTMAAEFATPESLNFMIRFGRGLLCMPCDSQRLDALHIPRMVDGATRSADTPFGVSIDDRSAGTGISVQDRAATIRRVLDPSARPWDFRRPGHMFPLHARSGGVLERPGHTEAAVDLCDLAGLTRCAVICEVLRGDGDVARLDDLTVFAEQHGLALASVDDLIEYRLANDGRERAIG